jgi:hypothetical protein
VGLGDRQRLGSALLFLVVAMVEQPLALALAVVVAQQDHLVLVGRAVLRPHLALVVAEQQAEAAMALPLPQPLVVLVVFRTGTILVVLVVRQALRVPPVQMAQVAAVAAAAQLFRVERAGLAEAG